MKQRKVTVIGLATFGEELAVRLQQSGAEVTALDIDPQVVQAIRDKVSHCGVADGREAGVLREFNVDQSDVVVIGTRSHLEMSILILLTLKDLEVKEIVALAADENAARALELMGRAVAGNLKVVFPERDIAAREAQCIINPELSEYVELAEDFSFVEIALPEEFAGKSLPQLDVRRQYGVNVIAVRDRKKKPPFVPTPDYQFEPHDRLLIVGPDENIRKMVRKTQ